MLENNLKNIQKNIQQSCKKLERNIDEITLIAVSKTKSIEMIKSKDLLAVAGYIHGGCSPIGMKKNYKTTIDIQANECDTIVFSAGKIGFQVELSLNDLAKVIQYQLASVAE